jgi:hypothetical protein
LSTNSGRDSTSKVGGGKIMIANTIILMTEEIASYVVELVTKNASILGSSFSYKI